ncbi:hypothetical protein BGW80DRAFT_1268067 [Lactifluus volemus]|nr:hypothetical protein BGW80DRAFT_1268067 [Lactifluus volemus]
MTSYPVAQYGGENQQHETYNEPPPFNPYSLHRPQESYDQNHYSQPYTDEPSNPLPQAQPVQSLAPVNKEASAFSPDEFAPPSRKDPSARNLRAWRYEQGRPLWTRGSRPGCFCRFFFCTFFITLFLIVGIVLSLALWIRPPDIIVGSINGSSSVVAQGATVLNDGIEVNLGLPVEVVNPNYFSAKLTNVHADIIYPINNTLIGNGTLKNVDLPSHTTTTFTFPFSLHYTEAIDPNRAILEDLIAKCGGSQKDLTITYKLTVGVKVFFITVSPTISNPISFPCPIPESTLQGA